MLLIPILQIYEGRFLEAKEALYVKINNAEINTLIQIFMKS